MYVAAAQGRNSISTCKGASGPSPNSPGKNEPDDHYTALQNPRWKEQRGGQEPAKRAFLRRGFWGFPGGTVVKNLPANAGDTGSSPGPGRSHMSRSN